LADTLEPETWDRELSPEKVATFEPVVDRYYTFSDSLLGAMMSLGDENTVVIVCSDHGFIGHRGYPGFEGGVATGSQMHRKEGVLFMSGPGIAAGRTIEGATVLDITPTILEILGLPVARDMDGRPLTEAFDTAFATQHPPTYIDTYEVDTGVAAGDSLPVQSPVDEEIKEMLRSLGYIN
jgi:hypothetical protein